MKEKEMEEEKSRRILLNERVLRGLLNLLSIFENDNLHVHNELQSRS
jgi:hypothetical protein